MPKQYPRIDEIIQGKKFDHCFRILTPLENIDGPPAEYVRKHQQKWTNGQYNLAASYLNPEKVQLVDIETRGLAKTNQTWLVGSAHMNAKGLVIEQFLARDPLEEGNVIKAFFNVTHKKPYWISFNGETFDESRLLARANAYLLQTNPRQKHIDVFRIYTPEAKKRGLKRVTLRELEHVVFPKFKRQNHIEGKDIPIAYDKYINGGDPLPIKNAIDHNTYDLVSLAALYLMAIEKGR